MSASLSSIKAFVQHSGLCHRMTTMSPILCSSCFNYHQQRWHMSQLSDEYADDGIDWDEAILSADAVEAARREGSTVPTEAPVAAAGAIDAATHAKDTGDDLLLVDLLDVDWDSLTYTCDGDIEDLGGMIQSRVRSAQKTLFEQFRKRRGFLSVTDLTAPSGWCEVQYAYSLLGRRDLKPEDRPAKIVTAAGAEIKVDKKIAVAHEKVLEKGRQVHKVLEREVHPEQVLVQTDTKVDRWALRLLNQIVSLVTLRDTGKAREIPIFGFFDDVFVMGVMDEIEGRPLPGSLKSESPTKSTLGKITDFFSFSSPKRKPKHAYYLVDSKTRRIPTLPKKEYTVSSRYQLMLYKYLFDTQASDTFDWARLWTHIRLDPDSPLSDSFLQQTKSICDGTPLKDLATITTLGQLADILRSLHVEVGALQTDLELVYRWRAASSATPRRKRSPKRKASEAELGSGQSQNEQDLDLQAAIAASLKQATAIPQAPPAESANPAIAAGTAMAPISLDDSSEIKTQPKTQSDQASSGGLDIWELANKANILQGATEGSIIGTEKFVYVQDTMMEYVRRTLAFWNGREPQGVSIEETNKCRNCEFHDGCEWLAAKAEEHRNKVSARRRPGPQDESQSHFVKSVRGTTE